MGRGYRYEAHMNELKRKHNIKLLIAILIIVGLIFGWAAYKNLTKENLSETTYSEDYPKAMDAEPIIQELEHDVKG